MSIGIDHAEMFDAKQMEDDALQDMVDDLLISGSIRVMGVEVVLSEVYDTWRRSGATVSEAAGDYILEQMRETSDH